MNPSATTLLNSVNDSGSQYRTNPLMEGVTTVRLNNAEFKGFVIGCVLGDGSLVYSGSNHKNITNNPHLCIAHKIPHKDYILMKAKILEQMTGVTIDEMHGKLGDAIRLRTRAHPFYRRLEDRMYFKRNKTVDEHVMKCLTTFGLLVWYLDDGHADEYTDNWSGIRIATNCFDYAQNSFICQMLKYQFELPFDVLKVGKWFSIRLRAAFLPMLWRMFAPYVNQVPACMHYKLTGLERKAALNEQNIQSVLIREDKV